MKRLKDDGVAVGVRENGGVRRLPGPLETREHISQDANRAFVRNPSASFSLWIGIGATVLIKITREKNTCQMTIKFRDVQVRLNGRCVLYPPSHRRCSRVIKGWGGVKPCEQIHGSKRRGEALGAGGGGPSPGGAATAGAPTPPAPVSGCGGRPGGNKWVRVVIPSHERTENKTRDVNIKSKKVCFEKEKKKDTLKHEIKKSFRFRITSEGGFNV